MTNPTPSDAVERLDLTKPVIEQSNAELSATLEMQSGWAVLRENGEGPDIRAALLEAARRIAALAPSADVVEDAAYVDCDCWNRHNDDCPNNPREPTAAMIEAGAKAMYETRHNRVEWRVAGSPAKVRYTSLARAAIAAMQAAPALAPSADVVEQVISAWAFAHDIDGAARNDLFKRLAALNRTEPKP